MPEGDNARMNPNVALPRPVAITIGDVCGIGPEIIAKLFRDERASGCLVIGEVGAMRRAAAIVGGSLAVARIEGAADVHALPPRCGARDRRSDAAVATRPGRCGKFGAASWRWLRQDLLFSKKKNEKICYTGFRCKRRCACVRLGRFSRDHSRSPTQSL
jgi:hypothetical protein